MGVIGATFMEISFSKMHGLGNDFVIISDMSRSLERLIKKYAIANLSRLAKKICNGHFALGADGLVILHPPTDKNHDFVVLHFNPDGSQAEICGNALRCCHFFAKKNKLIEAEKKEEVRFLTKAGVRTTCFYQAKKNLSKNTVIVESTMGNLPKKQKSISLAGLKYHLVSVGNPHAVCFVDDFSFDYHHHAKKLQTDKKLFPKGINVEYAHITSPNKIEARILERGVGETLCCGSGACAIASVFFLREGSSATEKSLHIKLLGGELVITIKNQELFMRGPATFVARGHYLLD